jgi:hypothetical protein
MSSNQPQTSSLNPGPENPLEHNTFIAQTNSPLLEKLRCQTSQLKTAILHLNETPESQQLKKLITGFASFFEQDRSLDSTLNFKNLSYAVSRIQHASDRYEKKFADSFETFALKAITSASNAILQCLVADILQKENLFSSEPILCGKGSYNWVFTSGDQVIYIPRATSIDPRDYYLQRALCLKHLHDIDPSHPLIHRIGTTPFPYAIGDLVKGETVSAIFQSLNTTHEDKIQAAQAVGAYLHTAIYIQVEGFGKITVKDDPSQKIIGEHTTWQDYLHSLVNIHRSSTSESIAVMAKIQREVNRSDLSELLLLHTQTLHDSKLKTSLIFPDPNPNNFTFRSKLKVCSTDWDGARVSTSGEMASHLLYNWVFLKEWEQPQYKHLNFDFRIQLFKSALRILVPNEQERVQAKQEGYSWLVLRCYARAADALLKSEQSTSDTTKRNAERFIEELKSVLMLDNL